MTTLADEVKASFEKPPDDQDQDKGPIVLIDENEPEMVPGFDAARDYYGHKLLSLARRGYRHFAGSTMPTDADELLNLTSPVMTETLIMTLLESFTDGVMIGQRSDYLVKRCFHFNSVEHLFHDDDFRTSSLLMANGFSDDREVIAYFVEYLNGGLLHVTHSTGFSHSQTSPEKVWDIWLLVGSAAVAASYLAGQRLGSSWRERDVLDGIELASEVSDGPAGEDG